MVYSSIVVCYAAMMYALQTRTGSKKEGNKNQQWNEKLDVALGHPLVSSFSHKSDKKINNVVGSITTYFTHLSNTFLLAYIWNITVCKNTAEPATH